MTSAPACCVWQSPGRSRGRVWQPDLPPTAYETLGSPTPWLVAQWGALGLVILGLAWEVVQRRRELAEMRAAQETARQAHASDLRDLRATHANDLRDLRATHATELALLRGALDAERAARLSEARDSAKQSHELAAQLNRVLDRLDQRRPS